MGRFRSLPVLWSEGLRVSSFFKVFAVRGFFFTFMHVQFTPCSVLGSQAQQGAHPFVSSAVSLVLDVLLGLAFAVYVWTSTVKTRRGLLLFCYLQHY